MEPALTETIERSRARLGMSDGEILKLAREVAGDHQLKSVNHLTLAQACGLITALESLVSVG